MRLFEGMARSIRASCDSAASENTTKEDAVNAGMDAPEQRATEDDVRILNGALRAEVERLRREKAEACVELSKAYDRMKMLEGDRTIMRQTIEAKDRRIEAFKKQAAILLEHLDGEDPAWWMEAARAMMALRREHDGPACVEAGAVPSRQAH